MVEYVPPKAFKLEENKIIINSDGSKEYRDTETFLKLKVPKVPSDECYTKKEDMEEIHNYFIKNFNIKKKQIVCPFFPGGDYKSVDYKGKVVIDNPPFSIISNILDFYYINNVKFVLFGNVLTILNRISKYYKNYNKKLGMFFLSRNLIFENGLKLCICLFSNINDDIRYIELSNDTKEKKVKKQIFLKHNEMTGTRLNDYIQQNKYIKNYIYCKNRLDLKGNESFGAKIKILDENFIPLKKEQKTLKELWLKELKNEQDEKYKKLIIELQDVEDLEFVKIIKQLEERTGQLL